MPGNSGRDDMPTSEQSRWQTDRVCGGIRGALRGNRCWQTVGHIITFARANVVKLATKLSGNQTPMLWHTCLLLIAKAMANSIANATWQTPWQSGWQTQPGKSGGKVLTPRLPAVLLDLLPDYLANSLAKE